jgi:hypothetical protein
MNNLQKELQEFNHERFNWHYRNLVDVAITATREDDILQTLSFLDSLQTFIEKIDETLKNFTDEPLVKQPDETHCVMCAAKEESIQALKKLNEELRKSYEEQRERVKTYEKIIENKEELIRILKGENGNPPDRYLKVCEK